MSNTNSSLSKTNTNNEDASAFVLVKLTKPIAETRTKLKKIKGIDSIYFVNKDDSPYDAIIKVTSNSINSLHKIILVGIVKSECVSETTTMIVMD